MNNQNMNNPNPSKNNRNRSMNNLKLPLIINQLPEKIHILGLQDRSLPDHNLPEDEGRDIAKDLDITDAAHPPPPTGQNDINVPENTTTAVAPCHAHLHIRMIRLTSQNTTQDDTAAVTTSSIQKGITVNPGVRWALHLIVRI